MANTHPKEILTVIVSDLARGGAAVAKDANGRVLFIPHAAPGDKLRVEVLREEKHYADARILEILQPSPQRVSAPCKIFGQCGGCEWQHIPYELQWSTKFSGLKHAIKRTQVEYLGAWTEIPATQVWNYRNRIQLRGFQNQIGFYARGSKDLVPMEECKIARKELNEKIPSILERGRELPRPYKVELEVMEDGEVREAWNQGHAALGFRQVHDEQNARLKNWVKKEILALKQGSALCELFDLFGGHGNLSLDLATEFQKIFCVDISSPEKNPPPATPANYHFFQSTVADWLKIQKAPNTPAARLAILDPPRDGLGENFLAILESMAKMQISAALLIGCDADAWARDLARMQRHHWKIQSLGALDLFPQTHHVEALAVLIYPQNALKNIIP